MSPARVGVYFRAYHMIQIVTVRFTGGFHTWGYPKSGCLPWRIHQWMTGGTTTHDWLESSNSPKNVHDQNGTSHVVSGFVATFCPNGPKDQGPLAEAVTSTAGWPIPSRHHVTMVVSRTGRTLDDLLQPFFREAPKNEQPIWERGRQHGSSF